MLRVLLDTNQLVSSLLSKIGLQSQLIDHWRARSFLLLLLEDQIDEVEEVLSRRKIAAKYRILPADRETFLNLLRADAFILPQARPAGICRDPDDDQLLGCAAAGGADYLVTGDRDLLVIGEYEAVKIVDARTFLSILATE